METPNDPKFNPYQVPTANAILAGGGGDNGKYIPGGRSVAAGNGVEWLMAAWRLFVEAPLMWIVMIVLYALFFFVLAWVPIIGSLIGYLLYAVVGVGWLAGAHAVAQGGKLELDHLFAGFKNKTGPLVVLGVFYIATSMAIIVVIGIFMVIGLGTTGALSAFMSGDISQVATVIAASLMTFLLAVLIGLALLIPVLMAMWFAPALVYFHDEAPMTALKVSFLACLRNFLPFLLYGILLLIVFIVAAIPLMLGFLIAGPLALISGYTSYRDLFIEGA